MHQITLTSTPDRVASAESEECFTVTGPGVHNPHHSHRIVEFPGRLECCADLKHEHLHMMSGPVVIAADPVEQRAPELPIAIGDRIKIDGEEWILIARRYADPVLYRPCQSLGCQGPWYRDHGKDQCK